MSSYNSAWREPLSSQTTDDIADAGGHHHHEGEARDLGQIQIYYHEQDYEARGRRYPGWSNHRPNTHDGISSYYSEEHDVLHLQQQYYHRHLSAYGQQAYPSWNGGQGYGYSPGAVYPPSSLYDTSSDYKRRAPDHGVTSPAQFDKCDVAPVGDPPPRSPSPSYLSNSLSPSERDEHPSRKLLILDLNGTLLLRSSPPRFRLPPPPRSPSPRATEDTPQRSSPRAPPPSQPLKRSVYARPYLQCFREYLFHSSTRCWLDVMIWSSAQPHSVQAMLQKCFPTRHKLHSGTNEGDASNDNKLDDRFIAVWARDSLGLSRFDYSRKTPTIKDLHKPWRHLPPVSGLDSKAVEESSLPSDLSISENVIRHSARTTLLLDDTPRKAYLQPWNHVCLKEYDSTERHRDLKVLQNTPQKMPMQQDIDTRASDDELYTAENPPSIAPPPRSTKSPGPTPLYQHSFDPTLLAIIGILEAVKHESNVAGWIRGNGLWPLGDAGTAKKSQGDPESEPAYQVVSSTKRPRDDRCDESPLDSLAKSKPIKRPRLHASPQPVPNDSTADSLNLSTDPLKSSNAVDIPKTHESPGGQAVKHGSEKHVDDVLQHISNKDEKIASTDTSTCWFSHTPTFAHWVSRGRDALARLRIDERHGVSEEEE